MDVSSVSTEEKQKSVEASQAGRAQRPLPADFSSVPLDVGGLSQRGCLHPGLLGHTSTEELGALWVPTGAGEGRAPLT